jgi:putative ABC transport system permease protein
VIIASFGGVIGVVVGLGFARAVVSALADQGLTEFSIPSTQIMIWLASAGLAGMIAAILPAWRASRLDVLDAISYE